LRLPIYETKPFWFNRNHACILGIPTISFPRPYSFTLGQVDWFSWTVTCPLSHSVPPNLKTPLSLKKYPQKKNGKGLGLPIYEIKPFWFNRNHARIFGIPTISFPRPCSFTLGQVDWSQFSWTVTYTLSHPVPPNLKTPLSLRKYPQKKSGKGLGLPIYEIKPFWFNRNHAHILGIPTISFPRPCSFTLGQVD